VFALSTLLAQASPGGSGVEVTSSTLLVLLGVGFLVATAGHIVRSRPLIAFGLALVFGATVLFPVLNELTS
jgi:hypothetical protein